MMLIVVGEFRLPPEKMAEAAPMMRAMIEASRAEEGCITYAYAEDVLDPGLVRVNELWKTNDDLEAHFESDHMRLWVEQRTRLGMTDRNMRMFNVSGICVI